MKRAISILLTTLTLLIACIDEISIPLSNDSVLVIEGLITDEPKAHKVQLSYSHSFNENPVFNLTDPIVLGATVEISDNIGNNVLLIEGGNGSYFTPPDFAGITGRFYSLKVTLKNGKVYTSSPERLLPIGSIINDVCFENTLRKVSTGESVSEHREVTFSVDFTDFSESEDYYRWGYEAVYEVEAPLADNPPECDPRCDPCPEPMKTCWATSYDNEFLKVNSDRVFNGKAVENYEIYSTPADRKFNLIYAFNVELYSLTKSAFDYWSALDNQLNNNGTIFETPNHQIRGNIIDQNNPDQLVLGYFGASAKTTARSIVYGHEITGNVGPINCLKGGAKCIPPACIDCRKWPATNLKPDYWPR